MPMSLAELFVPLSRQAEAGWSSGPMTGKAEKTSGLQFSLITYNHQIILVPANPPLRCCTIPSATTLRRSYLSVPVLFYNLKRKKKSLFVQGWGTNSVRTNLPGLFPIDHKWEVKKPPEILFCSFWMVIYWQALITMYCIFCLKHAF